MNLRRSDLFKADFLRLPEPIRRKTERAIRLLISDLRHPSLKSRIVDPKRRIWKANINAGYRLTFQVDDDLLILRRVGAHDRMERSESW